MFNQREIAKAQFEHEKQPFLFERLFFGGSEMIANLGGSSAMLSGTDSLQWAKHVINSDPSPMPDHMYASAREEAGLTGESARYQEAGSIVPNFNDPLNLGSYLGVNVTGLFTNITVAVLAIGLILVGLFVLLSNTSAGKAVISTAKAAAA